MKFIEQKFGSNKEEIERFLKSISPAQKVLIKDVFQGQIYGEIIQESFEKTSYKIRELHDKNSIIELRYRGLKELSFVYD